MADQLCGAKRIFRSVIPAFLLAVSVGQIYAFTNFSSEIANYIGEKQEHVQFAFSLGIFFLGMGAAFFGKIVEKNIKLSTVIGTVLFLSGLLVTSLGISMKSLILIYLGYGFLLGTGTGVIYISPVKTMMLWFPKNKAIAAAIRTRSALPESFTIKKIGLGAGKRDFGMPNVLRAMLIEETAAADAPPAEIMILETNIDDSTGETLGLAMDSLLAAGALDVHYIPAFMKKNRPAWLLRVICREADVPAMERVIFTETSSIGLRKLPAARTCLARTVVDVTLPAGPAKVKKCAFDGQTFYYPEYESIRALAAASGVPFADLFRDAAETARANDER